MNHRCLILGATVLIAPEAARGQQTSLTLDVGTARMRYADSVEATAFSVSPSLRIGAPRFALDAAGSLSHLPGAWSNSGTTRASLNSPPAAGLSIELEGSAGGSAHSDGARTGQLLAMGRLRRENLSRGLWVGAGAGRTWDGSWRALAQGDIGGWLAGSAGTAVLRLAPSVVSDTIRYLDADLTLHRGTADWDADISFGARAGHQLPSLAANRRAWGSATVARWLSPNIGLVASAGAYPVDFAQGFPGGQFISLSLRFAPRRAAALDRWFTGTIASESSDVRAFGVQRVDDDRYRIRVLAPGAHKVEVAGDFTEWTAVALHPDANGWWETTVSLASGTHEVNVRVDGGGWTVPPGLTPLKDEFGGSVGLLVVP